MCRSTSYLPAADYQPVNDYRSGRCWRIGPGVLPLLVMLCAGLLAWPLSVHAVETGDPPPQAFAAEGSPLAVVMRTSQELAIAAVRARNENKALRAELQQVDSQLSGTDITPKMLEQARLDVASARSAQASIANREVARKQELTQVQAELEQLHAEQRQLQSMPGAEADARAAKLQAEIDSRVQLIAALQRLLNNLGALREQATIKLSLLNERYLNRQDRFQIPLFVSEQLTPNARTRKLQQEIDALLERATRLGNQAAAISGERPDALAEKYLLVTQTQDAEERAELKQLELRLMTISQTLQDYGQLLEAESVPLDALITAGQELKKVEARLTVEAQVLAERQRTLAGQRAIVRQRGVLIEGAKSSSEQQLGLIDKLMKDVGLAANQITALMDSTRAMSERLQRLVDEQVRRSIGERRRLPPDAAGWKRLVEGLVLLPDKVVRALLATVSATVKALAQGTAGDWVVIAAAEAGIILFTLWLRRNLELWIVSPRPGSTLAVPARSLHFSLLSLAVPAAWVVLALLLQLPRNDIILLLALLLIWPAVRLLLTLAHQLLLEREGRAALAVRRRVYGNFRWVLVLVSVLASLSVVGRVVTVSPLVEDVIDRFSMLCLLLIAWPVLQLRALLLSSYQEGQIRPGLRARLAAGMALLMTLVCAVAAVLGMVGYVPLAWSIGVHLGWLAIVFAGWLLAFGVLRDGVTALARFLASRYPGADFWLRNFILPTYRLAILGLIAAAGLLLIDLYGWNRETPGIRWIPMLLEIPLFSVGSTLLRIQDVLLVVLLVIAVFWAGNWSRQVSYRLLYGRVADPGIRQSLSTFTQYMVIVLGVVIALKVIGLDLTALTVFAGALGVGIGFGLQNIANNFISGILLLAERPLQVADMVTVDNFEGEVTHIGIRSLTVQTWDNQQVVIPNSAVISQPFINWTRGNDIMRSLLMVGISYDSDPHVAHDIVFTVLKEHPAVLAEPAPTVLLWDFADSAVVFRVTFYSHLRGEVSRLDVRSQLLFAIWDRFAESGIVIPYPQRDIHIRSLPGGGLAGTISDS